MNVRIPMKYWNKQCCTVLWILRNVHCGFLQNFVRLFVRSNRKREIKEYIYMWVRYILLFIYLRDILLLIWNLVLSHIFVSYVNITSYEDVFLEISRIVRNVNLNWRFGDVCSFFMMDYTARSIIFRVMHCTRRWKRLVKSSVPCLAVALYKN